MDRINPEPSGILYPHRSYFLGFNFPVAFLQLRYCHAPHGRRAKCGAFFSNDDEEPGKDGCEEE